MSEEHVEETDVQAQRDCNEAERSALIAIVELQKAAEVLDRIEFVTKPNFGPYHPIPYGQL